MRLPIGQKVKVTEKASIQLYRGGLFPETDANAEITGYEGKGRYSVKFDKPVRIIALFVETTTDTLVLHRRQLEIVEQDAGCAAVAPDVEPA